MPRRIILEKDRLVLEFSGLKHFETLEARFEVPYEKIVGATTSTFRFPPGTLRLGGLSLPFTEIREGHFEFQGSWYFVSFEDRDKVVTLYLDGFTHAGKKYSVVAFQVDDPEGFVERLKKLAPNIKPLEP
ncbi:MAG: hypothetical protein QW514_04640 [Thermoprotei archaeon]